MPRIDDIRKFAKQAGDKKYYEFKASSAEGETDLFIYDVIAWWGVHAAQFAQDLQKITTPKINSHINSPGGNVFDGIAISNVLKAHPAQVTTYIDGWAASIASIIALAGDKIVMAKNAWFMIHNPWALIAGDARDLRKEADVLDGIGEKMRETYMDYSGKSAEQVQAWMDEEKWFNAEKAVEAGFAHEITGKSETNASFDISIFDNVPDCIKKRHQATTKPTERELEQILRDSGFSRAESVAIVAKGYKGESEQRDSDQFAGIMEKIRQNTAILTN